MTSRAITMYASVGLVGLDVIVPIVSENCGRHDLLSYNMAKSTKFVHIIRDRAASKI